MSVDRGQPKGQGAVLAWVGGGCLVTVVSVFLMFLGLWWFGYRTEANKKLAEHPPSWVPLYTSTHPAMRIGWPNPRPWQVEGTVALDTADPPERVIDFYTDRLRRAGFEVAPLIVEEDRLRLRGKAPRGGRELEVTTGPSTEDTWIELRYTWNR